MTTRLTEADLDAAIEANFPPARYRETAPMPYRPQTYIAALAVVRDAATAADSETSLHAEQDAEISARYRPGLLARVRRWLRLLGDRHGT